ncbi:CerR family C-terminal domain-containing protein [Methylocystis rosea]|nr:CerR family C-terminal domain-containing protein [Methylocystis rosea]
MINIGNGGFELMRQADLRAEKKVDGHSILSRDTQAKMIQVAIEVFGAHGYEGASTRALAEKAGVNLASIPYHFGGKHGLYLAAARTIADYARERITGVVARLRDSHRADQTTRIDEALSSYIDLVIGASEPEAWTSFFVRCEHEADDAFRMIYEEAVVRFGRALTEAVAEAIGRDADDEALRIRVAVVLASIVNFRTLRNMTLGTLGWDQFNPDRLERLNRTIRQFALRELLSKPG